MKTETKSEIFEFLMHWLLQEQKQATICEAKIDEIYRSSGSDAIDIFSSKALSYKIELDGCRSKIMRIKIELAELAALTN